LAIKEGKMADSEHSGWAGWAAFAGFMMILVGSFNLIFGFVAVFKDSILAATSNSLVFLDVTTWGWWMVLIGAILIISGLLVLVGNAAGRTVGVIAAMLNAIAQLGIINLHPVWGVLIIVVDVIVIYALIVYGGELRASGG
jgi:hypothetical protein